MRVSAVLAVLLAAADTCNGGGLCVDTQTSNTNCGTCAYTCTLGSSCVAGACVCAQADRAYCGGVCTNIQRDRNNCGSCGNVCPRGTRCRRGICR